jgi:hypothetical protein
MLPSDETNPAAETSQPANLNTDAGAPLQNPLHGIYREHLAPKNLAGQAMAIPQQNQPAPQNPALAASGIAPAPPLPQQVPLQAPTQGNNDASDETIWMQRTKAVVEQTQNDPHKRLQMIQQLQAQYQAEHFRKDNGGVLGS